MTNATSPKWAHLLNGPESAQTVVFSGGACNVIDKEGNNVRNTERDQLNTWLNDQNIPFFDPQIHPDTHGREYDWDIDGPAEKSARDNADVTIYQIGNDTQAVSTCLEVIRDAGENKNVILLLTGNFDTKGNPIFEPEVEIPDDGSTISVHLKQYVDNGNKGRKNILAFVKNDPNVTICITLQEVQAAISNYS